MIRIHCQATYFTPPGPWRTFFWVWYVFNVFGFMGMQTLSATIREGTKILGGERNGLKIKKSVIFRKTSVFQGEGWNTWMIDTWILPPCVNEVTHFIFQKSIYYISLQQKYKVITQNVK